MEILSEGKDIIRIFLPHIQPEGDGMMVWRLIDSSEVCNFDPFLLIDHFEAVRPRGYCDHPHRGHEVITYLLEGIFKFEDFKGNDGELHPETLGTSNRGKALINIKANQILKHESLEPMAVY